jgi:tRNA modification GTPase
MTVRSESGSKSARRPAKAAAAISAAPDRSTEDQRDTIFALSSAPGRAGVAVFRVSGPSADRALSFLTGKELPSERHAEIRTLFDKSNNSQIDNVLVLRFVPPRSYTGENIVEFQTHGGKAVIASMLEALAKIPGLRPAEAGEFTRRAVENGRLDLTQAEAIADLINAETDAQRRQALRQYEGELGALYEGWRGQLIKAAAWLEAAIDFAEDEVPPSAMVESRQAISLILKQIQSHLADGRRGEILREGLHVAIIGPPNVGKSSLLNALAQRDVAIVSEVAGTTRDIIEVKLDLAGYPVILADTAGIRDVHDGIEAEGVRRAEARAKAADLRLLLLDSTAKTPFAGLAPGLVEAADLTAWNKSDLPGAKREGLLVSAKTGHGLPRLIKELSEKAKISLEHVNEAPVLTRARHRQALEEAASSLTRAAEVFSQPELAAEEMRRALRSIGRITGRVDLEELLDAVFRDFCIGK